MTRLESGGRIDRTRPLNFTFDGTSYIGSAGDTVASALLANGVARVATSVALGRPRGIVSAGPEEPSAVVQIDEPFAEPMVTATTIELYDGFVGSSLAGQGRLAQIPDPARYDSLYAHCEVLVVGAGLAGLAAAIEAGAAGQRVILLDERPAAGGWSRGRGPAGDAVSAALAALAERPNVQVLTRTTAFGYYDDNFIVAVQRRTNHLGSRAPAKLARERLWRIRAGRVVLATGAHERLIAFANNDLPGVMLAGAAQEYVNLYAVRPGRRAVVFTNNDSAYGAALDLAAAGVEVVAIVDVRTPSAAVPGLAVPGIRVLAGHVVVAATGTGGVEAVRVVPSAGGAELSLSADLLAVSGGWNPLVHLFSQSGGNLTWSESIAAFVPGQSRQKVSVIGAANGDGLDPVQPCWYVDSADPQLSFVDLQRDVTISDLRRATGAGLHSVEHVKRYTTAGTAHDQGKTSGLLTSAVVADTLGAEIAKIGTTSFRAPYVPVAFATLAGRASGDLLDPIRVTSIHDWHVEHGALFENVGQWKRPWYYPQLGENIDAAVLRECAAARTGVAFMDGSTLGKIEIQGPDAGAFLDLIYTNLMSTLKVGSIRYGAMCHADGMIFDDGTVFRLAPDRFLATTTTGNAAAVLDWMEEWLQTEWPHLRVYCTSVTEQWATVAVVGPRSRAVLAELTPGLDVANDSFPFMTWRDTVVAGMLARVARISFSGELAYEINVPWTQGMALWQAIAAVGAPFGITPYGTETMHVLRAEKGYPIIGQDSDGTITPQDLGMDWVVSKKKLDFIGKRSYARAVNQRPDRKHLVGLLPVEPDLRLVEGTQLIEAAVIGPRRCRCLVSSPRPIAAPNWAGRSPWRWSPAVATESVRASMPPSAIGRRPSTWSRRSSWTRRGNAVTVDSSPLAGFADRFAQVTGASTTDVRISEKPLWHQLNLRIDPDACTLLASELGLELPTRPNTVSTSGRRQVLWLGPDEWLLLTPDDIDGLEDRLRAAAGPTPISVVDVSATRTIISLSGPAARLVLAHGCGLDLAAAHLAPGTCAQTKLALANIILLAPQDQPDDFATSPTFFILVRSSFARYLASWLVDAATEYTGTST